MPNAKASAQLLSSITDYQYCRRAWSKELFDTFLDPGEITIFVYLYIMNSWLIWDLRVYHRNEYLGRFIHLVHSKGLLSWCIKVHLWSYLSSDFFVIDTVCLVQWKVIIEHLIAHDNLLFTDLLTRVTVAAGGLFSSNEVPPSLPLALVSGSINFFHHKFS